MFKKIAGSFAVAALLASSSFAVTSETSATDLVGDFLIAPNFFATGGWETKLKLVNTDTDSSILVRAVVRDYVASYEFDFPILLSPGDVWTATLSEVNGVPTIKSSDDSNYFLKTNPYLKETNTPVYFEDGVSMPSFNKNAAGKFAMGYVEFYPIAQYDENAAVLKANGYKIPKSELLKRFKDLENFNTTTKYSSSTDAKENSVNAIDVNDSLTASVTLYRDASNLSMTIPAIAFSDASHADLKAIGTIIKVGQATDTNVFIKSTDVYSELKTSEVYVPYDNSNSDANQLLFTFWNDLSTKQTRTFAIESRDNSETLYVRGECPSPGCAVYAKPYESFTWSFGQIASDLLDLKALPYEEGWFKLSSITNYNSNQPYPALIATYMKAVSFSNGGYTTNWNYLPTK